MKHEWMRQEKVDVSEYLPKFLSKDERFKTTNDADSEEHEKIRVSLQDVLDQFFVDAATWALEKWEELLGIGTDTSKSDEARREAIIEKIQWKRSVTVDYLTSLIDNVSVVKTAKVVDHPESYSVDIDVDASNDMDKIMDVIRTYIPAHIGYGVRQNANTYRTLMMAMALDSSDNIDIYPGVEISCDNSGTEYFGAAYLFELEHDITYSVIPDEISVSNQKYIAIAMDVSDEISIFPEEEAV